LLRHRRVELRTAAIRRWQRVEGELLAALVAGGLRCDGGGPLARAAEEVRAAPDRSLAPLLRAATEADRVAGQDERLGPASGRRVAARTVRVVSADGAGIAGPDAPRLAAAHADERRPRHAAPVPVAHRSAALIALEAAGRAGGEGQTRHRIAAAFRPGGRRI